MNAQAITPTQKELLKMFAFNHSDQFAKEIKQVLTRHFLTKITEETDRLWEDGTLNQEKLDEIRHKDLHKHYSNGASCR